MLLTLDIGNSNIVLGCFINQTLKYNWRFSTHPICASDELKAKIDSLLNACGLSLHMAQAIAVCSVVPNATQLIKSTFLPSQLFIIDHTWPFSFEIKANPPSQVGIDRLVNAEAVMQIYGGPSIIIDMGTATTICALTRTHFSQLQKKAEFLGGAIIPGLKLSMEALANRAALLYSIDLEPPQNVIGNNTRDALKSGIMFGYTSMIDGMIHRFKSELSDSFGIKNCSVVATGGISHLLKNLSKEIQFFDPDLTLKGISYLYDAIHKRQLETMP